jgi:hypothetical protein
MENNRIIAGAHAGYKVAHRVNAKGVMVVLPQEEVLLIDKTTVTSIDKKNYDPNAFAEDMSMGRAVWLTLLLCVALIAPLSLVFGSVVGFAGLAYGLGLDFFAIGIFIGVALPFGAVMLFIFNLGIHQDNGAYIVDVYWTDGTRSLIECDSQIFRKILVATH